MPGWLWLITGALVGAFVMFLLHLNGLTPATPEPHAKTETTVVEAPAPAENGDPQQQVSAPRLQFYELLKESTVEVPEPDPATIANTETEATQYILQAGSFKQSDDANRMRAELILLNLNASVEAATSENKQVWYRVMVGPFDNRSRMAKARSILVSHDINPLLIKRAKVSG